jgi:O-antigen ligase/tetratricopeptide (TPR) repeat protein
MTTDRYLKYFIFSGLFLIPLVPLIIWAESFFPFITGKNFAFRLIVELIFGAWVILALRNEHYRPKASAVLYSILSFVFVMGLATLFSEYPYKSFWSNFERMEGYITVLHLAAYFLVASSVLNSEKLWSAFLNTSVGTSVVIGIYGLLQLSGNIVINQGGVRLDGTLGNAAYLGAYMLLHFFITLFLLSKSKGGGWVKTVYASAMVLQFIILFYTATRGAILGLIVGTFVTTLIISLHSKKWHFQRKIALSILVLVIAIISFAYAFKNSKFVLENPTLTRLSSISVKEAGPRFMVWNMAWQGFKERPILGWGQESFNYVFNKYYDPGMYAQEQWFDRTHNVFFDWLIAGGILGLLSYLFIFASIYYYIWKQGNDHFSVRKFVPHFLFFWRGKDEISHLNIKAVLTGLVTAYLFQNLFVFDNITSYIIVFTIASYIHALSGKTIKKLSGEHFKIDRSTTDRVLAPIVLVLTIFVVYTANIPQVKASLTLIEALKPQSAGVLKNLENFKKALSYETFGDPEIREQLTQASLQALSVESVDIGIRQQFYELTINELANQVEKTPNDARYFLFQGSFLNRVQRFDEALVALKRAVELSPTKQTILFELGSTYLNKGDTTNALETLRTAFELNQNFNEARIIYAVGAIMSGDKKLTEEIMAPIKGTDAYFDERIVSAYLRKGDLSKVVELSESKALLYPDKPEAQLALASAYVNANMMSKALAVLEMMAQKFPAQKEQVEGYIREIKAGRTP